MYMFCFVLSLKGGELVKRFRLLYHDLSNCTFDTGMRSFLRGMVQLSERLGRSASQAAHTVEHAPLGWQLI